MTIILIAGMIGAVVVLAASAVWWRVAAKSLFFIALFEGAIRKWLIPSGSELFYFLKDGVLLGALLGWAVARWSGSSRRIDVFWSVFAAAALMGVVQMFNPTMASPVVGAFGWKAYFLWAGVTLVLPDTFRTLPEVMRYLRTVLAVSIPVCLLAVLQFQLPPSHFLNVYAWDSAAINQFGDEGNVRVTGTFPFLSGYTGFLSFLVMLLIPLVATVRARSIRWLALVLTPLVAGTSFMTGGRVVVFFSVIYLAAFIPLGVVTRAIEPARIARFLVPPALAAGLIVILFFGKARDAFMQRAAGAEQVGDTLVSRTVDVALGAFSPQHFSYVGDGIGSENNAGRIAGAMLGWPSYAPPRPVEAEPNRVMAELGLFGWLLWYAFKLCTIGAAWLVFRRMRTPVGRALALSVFCYLGINIMTPLAFDQILAVFYWIAVGLGFGLPQWEAATVGQRPEMVRRFVPLPLRVARPAPVGAAN